MLTIEVVSDGSRLVLMEESAGKGVEHWRKRKSIIMLGESEKGREIEIVWHGEREIANKKVIDHEH